MVTHGACRPRSLRDVERIRELERSLGVAAVQVAPLVADVGDDRPAFLGVFLAHRGLERLGGLRRLHRLEMDGEVIGEAVGVQVFLRAGAVGLLATGQEDDGHAARARGLVDAAHGLDDRGPRLGHPGVPMVGHVAEVLGAHVRQVGERRLVDVEHEGEFLPALGRALEDPRLRHGGIVRQVLLVIALVDVGFDLLLEQVEVLRLAGGRRGGAAKERQREQGGQPTEERLVHGAVIPAGPETGTANVKDFAAGRKTRIDGGRRRET